MPIAGRFITFEGGEGAGKSTQLARLAERLRADGATVLGLREPGGTPYGERMRDVLKQPGTSLAPAAEALLFASCRAQLVADVIAPALAAGQVVICDRFIDSTVAYQAGGRGLREERVPIVTLAPQRDEQVAGLDRAGVGAHRVKFHIATGVLHAERLCRLRYAHHV